MAVRKGIDYLIKIEDSSIADTFNILGGQRGATLSLSQDVIDTTVKGDGWKTAVGSFKQWSVSGDGLILDSGEAFDDVVNALTNNLEIKIEFDYTGSAGTEKWTGSVIVTSFDLEAGYDAEATYSIELQGTGALTRA